MTQAAHWAAQTRRDRTEGGIACRELTTVMRARKLST